MSLVTTKTMNQEQQNTRDEYLRDIDSEVKKVEGKIEQLKRNQEDIVSEIQINIKKWLKKWSTFLVGGFSLLTIYTLYCIYTNVIDKSEKFITESITLKFAEPKIAKTLNLVAENQAHKIIEDNLNPAIQKAILSVNEKIVFFDKDLQEFKEKYDLQLKKLAQEVNYLKNRNEVLKLSDEAIATGDAAPFEQLQNIYDSSADEHIKKSALSEILRVKNHFATMTRIKGLIVRYTDPKTGKELTDKEIPTEALIQRLRVREAEPWQLRARIAELLKERKEKQVPEALLEAVKNDKKLEVRKNALDSFESVTGFSRRDVFEYTAAKGWWEQNKQRVETGLQDLQRIEQAIKKTPEN